jgi:hypothetical protein
MVFERNLERVEDGKRELYKIEGQKNGEGSRIYWAARIGFIQMEIDAGWVA